MANILDAYRAAFPAAETSVEMIETLASMPLDSSCGEDCAEAIEHGAAFLASWREAHGDDRPASDAMIAAMTASICSVFIRG